MVRWTFIAMALCGCIREPETKTCAEFPVDTNAAACGDPCQIYCEALVEACPDSIDGADKLTVCRGNCLEISAGGNFGDDTGDTLQCRITAAVAARADATQCDNASFGGGSECSDNRCGEYCEAMAANCDGAYNNLEGCLATCAVFPTGGSEDSGNSLECRAAAARRASSDANACNAAMAASNGTCGAACEGYCDQVESHCVDGDAIYAEGGGLSARQNCLATCAFMEPNGTFADYRDEADTVQCRAYHAGAPASADPGTHCPHASLYNDAHCGDTCGTFCEVCENKDEFEEDENLCAMQCGALVAGGGTPTSDPAELITECPDD